MILLLSVLFHLDLGVFCFYCSLSMQDDVSDWYCRVTVYLAFREIPLLSPLSVRLLSSPSSTDSTRFQSAHGYLICTYWFALTIYGCVGPFRGLGMRRVLIHAFQGKYRAAVCTRSLIDLKRVYIFWSYAHFAFPSYWKFKRTFTRSLINEAPDLPVHWN